ncbi:MAG: hypothetical protein ABR557_01535 [Pyrinomonadaceae bacterium]
MPFSIFRIGRVVLAMALALWVAGAGCLLGCEGMIAAAASEVSGPGHHTTSDLNVVVSGDACASAKSHDCCAKTKQQVQTKAQSHEKQAPTLGKTESSSSGMSACPLAMRRTAVAARNSSRDESSTTTFAGANLSIQNFDELTAPLATQVRMPNRGHTYLHCCSFRI